MMMMRLNKMTMMLNRINKLTKITTTKTTTKLINNPIRNDIKLLSSTRVSNTKSPLTEKITSKYPGALNSYFTDKLEFIEPGEALPTFRVMDEEGKIIDPNTAPQLTEELMVKMYKDMVTLNIMDTILYDAQRQGRISFYMTSFGEEAQIGSAAALTLDDVVFSQYRESGILLYRGFTLQQFMNQVYSNSEDIGKGRQMPIHYGSKKLNFQTVSSPLGTQLPQAAGAAYALKLSGKRACSIAYFGEGSASEGDFHVALNMAATLNCPALYFCRNNGFAISTPTHEQYRGDGIAARGRGYGIDTIRVDGNDILAVYAATKAAREMAIEQCKPVLIEAMTYRVGHHSTSDDSSAYRSKQAVEDWKRLDNPITRYRKHLESLGYWSESLETDLKKSVRTDLLAAFQKAESYPKPAISNLFTDVFDDLPPHLRQQQKEMLDHIRKYPDHYPVADHQAE